MDNSQNDDTRDINKLSAHRTDDIDEAPSLNGPADPAATSGSSSDDEVASAPTRTYQDDLDTGDEDVDPYVNEATEDPADLLQIPSSEFKDELDQLALDDLERGNEDMRETIEDRDEGDDNAASTA
jgi:hypothetical protein